MTGRLINADEAVKRFVDDALEDALFDDAETLAEKPDLVLSPRLDAESDRLGWLP